MYPSLSFLGLETSTYFLVISVASLISSLWFLRRASKHNLNRQTAIDLTLVILVSGFIGARLLHVFFEEPEFYRANPLAVLHIWNGGFVYLGGVVTAWFAATWFCQLKREPFWFWADIAVIPISFGYALGRLACFLNGCCYGRYCRLPWAVYMHGGSRHPTQLYAVLWELVVLGILIKIEPRIRHAGVLFNTWLVMHGSGRILMEHFRDDPRGESYLGLSIGTYMSLALIVYALSQLYRSPSK